MSITSQFEKKSPYKILEDFKWSHPLIFILSCVCAKLLQPCLTLQRCGLQPARLFFPWDSPGKNTEVDIPSSRGSSQSRDLMHHLGNPFLSLYLKVNVDSGGIHILLCPEVNLFRKTNHKVMLTKNKHEKVYFPL